MTRFDNSYRRLPERFYEDVRPTPVKSPRLLRLNSDLAAELGIDLPDSEEELGHVFGGNALLEGMEPLAQAYAGHQFGHFVPQLGDGRAHLLGEVLTPDGRRFDIQLKGSGQTQFSRGGDGRAPLGPVIREYVISEAMHRLGIPTTRSLAMAATGETVYRETPLPGAVLTRVASSHIRVGTFEFFASREDVEGVRLLADHVIERHYPDLVGVVAPYEKLYAAVCERQARLVARWLSVGFIHGVMNTDNTTLCGETIDYGPCAFMDAYNPAQVYSSIDHQGRYAYNNQPPIAQWNMACLGGCLAPLMSDDPQQGQETAQTILAAFPDTFKTAYTEAMCAKVGLSSAQQNMELVQELMELMHQAKADFTNTFRSLSEGKDALLDQIGPGEGAEAWWKRWREAFGGSNSTEAMKQVNPSYIPRNHRVEQVIRAAEDENDFAPLDRLIEVLAHPFDDQPEHADYRIPPRPDERVHQTFCGT